MGKRKKIALFLFFQIFKLCITSICNIIFIKDERRILFMSMRMYVLTWRAYCGRDSIDPIIPLLKKMYDMYKHDTLSIHFVYSLEKVSFPQEEIDRVDGYPFIEEGYQYLLLGQQDQVIDNTGGVFHMFDKQLSAEFDWTQEELYIMKDIVVFNAEELIDFNHLERYQFETVQIDDEKEK